MSRITRLAAVVSLVGAASVGAAISAQAAHASGGTDTDDSLSNKGTVVTMTNSGPLAFNVWIGVSLTPIHCMSVSARFTVPKTGLTATLTPVGGQPIQFTDCLDASIDPVTITTSGTWKINFKDAPNDETQSEPNTGDSAVLKIPVDGLTLVDSTYPACTVVLNSYGPSKANFPYDDNGTASISGPVGAGSTLSENCANGGVNGLILLTGDTFTLSKPIHDKS
jgi:hypothetical protein